MPRVQTFSHTRNQVIFWTATLLLFLGFIWLFQEILLPFILGTIIAYLLDPAVKKMRRRNIPRWAATWIILGSFGVFLIGILLLIAPLAYRELVQLFTNAPVYADRIWAWAQPYTAWIQDRLNISGFADIQTTLKDNISRALQAGTGIVVGLASGGIALINIVYVLILTPIVAFLMMNDWPRMKKWLDEMVPRASHSTVGDLWHAIDAKLAGFIRGQLIVAFALGAMYSIALTIAGLNYGFLIGFMAGLLSLIPLLGSTAGLFTSVLVAWFQEGEWSYVAIIAGIFFSGQFIEGNFLSPRLLGKSVGMHSLWILFALTAGGSLFGIVGLLVAVPVAAVIGVLAGFAIEQYKHSAVYNGPDGEPLPEVLVEPVHVEKFAIEAAPGEGVFVDPETGAVVDDGGARSV